MRKTIITLLLPFLFILSGCKKDTDILLQAGKYEFTTLDYDLLNVRTKNAYANSQQQDKLIENAYIIAFAFDNRYDTIKILSKKLFYGMRLYSSEVNGFVWNKKVKPSLKISEDELKKAYNKRSVQYILESIYFPDASLMAKYIKPGNNINNEKDFFELKQRVKEAKDVKCYMLPSIYPFNQFNAYSEKIIKAKKGDILQSIETSRGNYILRIVDIQSVKQRTFVEEKPLIEQQLINILSEKYIKESETEILRKANPILYDKDILYMVSKFDTKTRKWSDVNDRCILMNYQFKGQNKTFTIGDLKEYLACIPLFIGSPSRVNDMKELLKSYLMDIYLYEEAKEMNAETDEEFAAFKRYYQNKLFVQHYNELYVYPEMKITPVEVKHYYDQNKYNLKGFESATVSFYKFNDEQSAFSGYMAIKSFYTQKAQHQVNPITLRSFNSQHIQNQPEAEGGQLLSNLSGIKSITNAVVINTADTTFDANLINTVSQSNIGQTIMPMKIKGEFYVVYVKNKSGISVLPFKYAKNIIEQTLTQKKTTEVHNLLITGLKAKYPLNMNKLKEYGQKIEN